MAQKINKTVFQYVWWYTVKYDGRRKKYFNGMSKREFEHACYKRAMRCKNQWELECALRSKVQKVMEILLYFKDIPYEYEGDYLDDFNKYQRPCSNGVGYVAICPGEPANNYYTDNPIAVKILKRKYNEWKERISTNNYKLN